MQCLLLLAVLAECHNAVELLVVLTAHFTAELIDLILKTNMCGLNALMLYLTKKIPEWYSIGKC